MSFTATLTLHPLSEFVAPDRPLDHTPTYWYAGTWQGDWRLPRTVLAETIAQSLMQQLSRDERFGQEGKMYGILLVQLSSGELRVLKAFSGLLNGEARVEGWVPLIAGREQVALEEAHTLAQLEHVKQALIALQHLPERQQYSTLMQEFDHQLQPRSRYYRQRKQQRQQQRLVLQSHLAGEALETALEHLNIQSQRDGMEQKRWKQQQELVLQPLRQVIYQADARIQALKQERKALSQRLQAQLHQAYCLTNFAGVTLSLEQVVQRGMPTGTGDCCAPKLLHYAATHQLQPIALAEFWYGPASFNGDKQTGAFYGACADRCQPLMGFLLSGATVPGRAATQSAERSLPILYEDEWLMAIDKPAGLLSVPGRYADRQDSALSRLRQLDANLRPVHRLDQATSGILLFARDAATQRYLSQQFQQRRVNKVYEAVLSGRLTRDRGVIELPLWGDPTDRPRQQVHWQYGKPSLTQFQVLSRDDDRTYIEFRPMTGRTHQLRVHAADAQGLGLPIWGDRLYGCTAAADRLHLHARQLQFDHPYLNQTLQLQADTLFDDAISKI